MVLKTSGVNWYGVLQACHNPVVIPSFSIHIILELLPFAAPFASYLSSFCPDNLADSVSCNPFIRCSGVETLWEQTVRRKGATQQACPELELRSQDSTKKPWGHSASHIHKQKPPFGAQICSNSCSEKRTVLWNDVRIRGKLWASRNR